jgi:exonuclease III
MRYKVNKKYVAEREANKVAGNKITPDWNAPGPLRTDGQPDMRFAANKKYVAEREANKVAENKKTAEEINKMEAVKAKVKFGLVNAQSLLKKGEELEQLIAQSKLNVVAVTETWFVNDSELNDACPKGFQALHRPRIGRGGGGVAIFCRDVIDITRNYHKNYNSFEHLDVSIAIGSSEKIRIVTIYRPPRSSKFEFLKEFKDLLEASKGDKRIFTGDFNLQVEKPDWNARVFLDLFKSHGLVQHVKESTHEKGGILDLILSRTSDRLVENVRVGDYFSDHKSVECTILIEMKKEEIIESDDGQPDMNYAARNNYFAEIEENKVAENKKTAKEAKETEAVTGKVKFEHGNAQSLLVKEDQLQDKIAKSKLNVVAVTETFFANDSDLNDACPKGFQALHRPRIGRRGGGVAIFCQDNFEIFEHSNKSYKSFKHLDVSIAIGSGESIRIVTIYTPPESSKAEFLQEFKHLMEASKGDIRIVTGDFNLHVENP